MIDRSAATVAAIGEHGLIERLERRVGRHPGWVTLGIGDDAALIEPARGEIDVLATDSLIEDVHFRRSWTPASAIGHKALAVNLSDLAAMGATPRACLLSFGLPADLPVVEFDDLVGGLLQLAATARAPLVGGNIARSPGPLVVDVTVLGSVRRRRALRRSGAGPGHELYVTGSLGGALAGLRLLERGLERANASDAERACIERHERPSPRLRTGRLVGRQGFATAAIDLSDGLADGVRQLAAASGVGAIVEAETIPVDPAAVAVAESVGATALDLAISGGEDYELLFAVPPRRRRAFLAAVSRAGEAKSTRIGRLTTGLELVLDTAAGHRPLTGLGFEHFQRPV
jgi:thiamine-monophosphate kinase